MREIKFRGIVKYNGNYYHSGEMVYGQYSNYYNPIIQTKDYDNLGNVIRWHNNLEVIPETVGQYTGLKDKNKVEIYEGDIVKYKGNNYPVKYFEKYGMFGLAGDSMYKKYNEDDPMGSGGSSTKYKPYILNEFYQKRIEVIGNIHQNPELLNK